MEGSQVLVNDALFIMKIIKCQDAKFAVVWEVLYQCIESIHELLVNIVIIIDCGGAFVDLEFHKPRRIQNALPAFVNKGARNLRVETNDMGMIIA